MRPMIARPGNMDIQLDLFLDYANNVKLYPAFPGVLPRIHAAAARDMGTPSTRSSFRQVQKLSSGTTQMRACSFWMLATSHLKQMCRTLLARCDAFLI